MKNIFLLFMTITTFTVKGQNHLFGIKGGVSRNNVTASNFLSNNYFRTGMVAGLTYDFQCKEHFSIGAEIIYNQRGLRNNVVFTDDQGNPINMKATTRFNYDYIMLPLKFGYRYGQAFQGFTNLALTPAILGNAKTTSPVMNSNHEALSYETRDVTSRVNRFDLGGLVEVGCGYKVKNNCFLYSSFSYQQSFTSITNSDYFANSTIKHYGMIVNVGVKWALSKE